MTDAHIPVLDEETISGIQELDGDGEPELLRTLLNMFTSDTPLRIETLQRAIDNKDLAESAGVAHSLKSGSLGIGAQYLASVCAGIELHARQDNLAAAAALLPEVSAAYKEACSQLQRLL